jgi:excisionase family DNA binding protein
VAVTDDRLLDAAEVADLLHVSVRWVRDATRDGRIPRVALGRQVRYRRETILAWVAEQESTKRTSTGRSGR